MADRLLVQPLLAHVHVPKPAAFTDFCACWRMSHIIIFTLVHLAMTVSSSSFAICNRSSRLVPSAALARMPLVDGVSA